MADRMSAPKIRAMKAAGAKIVCITAYDVTGAQIADAAGVDVILIGDSLGNVLLGYDTTVPVDLQDMVRHTSAVSRAKPKALMVADMPFGSYQGSIEQAVSSAVALIKAGAEAVKLEGPYLEEIAAIVKTGIPVMGHVGMTPQSVHAFGGFKVQGRGDQAKRVLAEAIAVQKSGAFSIVLELIPSDLSYKISAGLDIPTIGIGAGPGCDGQIQVFHDLLGLTESKFRHVKRYTNGRALFLRGIRKYAAEVRGQNFPGDEHGF